MYWRPDVVNLHVYHYTGNNPIKYTDPDGRSDDMANTGLFNTLSINPNDIESMLNLLGYYDDPQAKDGPYMSTGVLTHYEKKIITSVSLCALSSSMGKYAETAASGGGVMPGPIPMMATGEAFSGTLELTLYRRKGSNSIDGWTLTVMRSDSQNNNSIGVFQGFSMQYVERRSEAESILRMNPYLLEKGLTNIKASKFQQFTESLFNFFEAGRFR